MSCYLLFCSILFAQSQAPSISHLVSSDVENFINNFPKIQVEFEKMDLDIDPQDDLEAITDGLASYEEINSVVRKYGYTDYLDFTVKASTIAACYASLKLKDGGGSEIEQAYKAIEMDESMTPSEKQLAKQQLDAILLAMGGSLSTMANDQDVAIVKPFASKLDTLFDEK